MAAEEEEEVGAGEEGGAERERRRRDAASTSSTCSALRERERERFLFSNRRPLLLLFPFKCVTMCTKNSGSSIQKIELRSERACERGWW